MVKDEPKKETKPKTMFCFKCKRDVKRRDFNIHYGICNDCVNGASPWR